MAGALSNLEGKSNCQTDITAEKVVALETKTGIGNYGVMREVEQLTNPDSGVYCYLEALAADRPDDLYLWSIPAGIS
jgi:hypothetical protein